MEDHELNQAVDVLDSGFPLLKFPPELEKQYAAHHAQTRLITSRPLIAAGLGAFFLFVILDYIVFPFNAAVWAWCIRGGTILVILSALTLYRYALGRRMGYGILSALAVVINASVVAIDIIGVNSAGYTLALGSLFVIIAACTLVRFPFWISALLVGVMFLTQLAGMLFLMPLGVHNILNNVFFYLFISMMMLISNYCADSDSRKIFLLNLYRRKYERSGLTSEKAVDYAEKLDQYMRDEKPYLDPDLRIEDVAKHLDVKRHHLTQIISEKYGKNFFSYINEFRVSDAKRMLEDRENDEMTVLRIAYDTGFNSKSSFNRIFKHIIGVSPSQYRETVEKTRK